MATPEEMEARAPEAENELSEMAIKAEGEHRELTIIDVAGWWSKWFGPVGHKRLGRILMQYTE